jgi:GxxExxY protein
MDDRDTVFSIPDSTERIAAQIIDAGLRVHTALGPGLLESAYEHCLAHELTKRGLSVQRQVPMPISYDGISLDVGYRIDLLVASCVIVEVKAVEQLLPIHQAQLLTYLRLADCRLGFLLNFNVVLFKSGIRRVVL